MRLGGVHEEEPDPSIHPSPSESAAPAGSVALGAPPGNLLSPAMAELSAAKAILALSEAARARDATRAKEAERWVAKEADRAHNAEQPIMLLPDALLKNIIDVLPSGR